MENNKPFKINNVSNVSKTKKKTPIKKEQKTNKIIIKKEMKLSDFPLLENRLNIYHEDILKIINNYSIVRFTFNDYEVKIYTENHHILINDNFGMFRIFKTSNNINSISPIVNLKL